MNSLTVRAANWHDVASGLERLIPTCLMSWQASGAKLVIIQEHLCMCVCRSLSAESPEAQPASPVGRHASWRLHCRRTVDAMHS